MNKQSASSQYQFLDKLGEGSFGYIWKVKDITTGQLFACKLVKNTMKKERTLLQREIKILQLLQGKKGFTQLVFSGQDHKNTYFIMHLLGDNLEQIKLKCGRFDTSTILDMGYQMIVLLRDLHNNNIIHRDIKPENFVVFQDKLHLIDFGLSKQYIQDGKHIEYKEKKGMIGTARYASINSLKGNEQSRRDDLESVGYLLCYLANGTLPWSQVATEDKLLKYYRIQKMKEVFKSDAYINLPTQLSKYFEYVKRLHFDQKPDYEYLQSLFKRDQDTIRTPKLQITATPNNINLIKLRNVERQNCSTSRPSLNQLDNTSRRITFDDLSSAGQDIVEEMDDSEGIQLKNLSVGIKQPKVKIRTGSDQIFEMNGILKFHQIQQPFSLKQLQ